MRQTQTKISDVSVLDAVSRVGKKDKKHFALTPYLQHLKTIFSPQQVWILYKAAEHNMTLDLIPV